MGSSLVEVSFEPASKTVWVQPGATLLQAATAAGVDVLTGCTRGMCGTDAVRIRAGAEGLAAAEANERSTLERMGLGDAFRLSCSAKVERGPITVEIDAF
ncbi:MAG: 2Fe-2S iron-sulfur cluster-binding protein [Planctomycetota bacterium]